MDSHARLFRCVRGRIHLSSLKLEHAIQFPASTRIGVIGTDPRAGKTVVASAIIAAMRSAGARVAPMKPIQSGSARDGERLRVAAGITCSPKLISPVSFADDVAPLVAARRAHVSIDVASLDAAFAELCTSADAVVVEGGAGFLTPITETESFGTMFSRWGLDLVVVAPNRVGAVNDVLLNARAATAAGMRIRAVVLNAPDRAHGGTAERTNQALLKEMLLTVPVLTFPFAASPDDPAALATLVRDLSVHTTIARPA